MCIIAEYDQRKATPIIRLITIIYMEICCMLFTQLILSGINIKNNILTKKTLSDSNSTRTHNHLVKQTPNHLAKK